MVGMILCEKVGIVFFQGAWNPKQQFFPKQFTVGVLNAVLSVSAMLVRFRKHSSCMFMQ